MLKEQTKDSKVIFFFGAGAEQLAFDLPSGADYTLETMLTKKEEMYSALKKFYKGTDSEYVDKYAALFLFTRDSHTFRKMVIMAAKEAIKDDDCDEKTREFAEKIEQYEEADKKCNNLKIESDEKLKTLKEQLKNLSEIIYDVIIDNEQEEGYESLKKHLSYYGVIEKDFATILAPKTAGKLSEFEYPTKLLVKDVIEDADCAEAEEIENNCFVFVCKLI